MIILDPSKDYGFTDADIKNISDLPVWDEFRLTKIHEIFQTCSRIVDFGNSSRMLSDLFAQDAQDKIKLHVDVNPSVHPDFVADICHMPMRNDSHIDGIICASILEHVYDPVTASSELYRILKPGGKLFLYVPWLLNYHIHEAQGVRDYFRLSRDSIRFLFSKFSSLEICPVRGRIETILNLIPSLGKRSTFHRWFKKFIRKIDVRTEETASGFNVFAIK